MTDIPVIILSTTWTLVCFTTFLSVQCLECDAVTALTPGIWSHFCLKRSKEMFSLSHQADNHTGLKFFTSPDKCVSVVGFNDAQPSRPTMVGREIFANAQPNPTERLIIELSVAYMETKPHTTFQRSVWVSRFFPDLTSRPRLSKLSDVRSRWSRDLRSEKCRSEISLAINVGCGGRTSGEKTSLEIDSNSNHLGTPCERGSCKARGAGSPLSTSFDILGVNTGLWRHCRTADPLPALPPDLGLFPLPSEQLIMLAMSHAMFERAATDCVVSIAGEGHASPVVRGETPRMRKLDQSPATAATNGLMMEVVRVPLHYDTPLPSRAAPFDTTDPSPPHPTTPRCRAECPITQDRRVEEEEEEAAAAGEEHKQNETNEAGVETK
ncbi:hypothetical protein J6590_053965 [Homalodisca vitripennis]|nr:hypothetical protein J6590_053965 [Homalodisca vitripennis]